MNSKLIKIAAVSVALFAANPTVLLAQTTAPAPGTSSTAPANTARTEATRTDDRTNYGWVGLIGLVGLAGLMGRNRHRHVDTTTTYQMGTRREL